MEQNASMEIYEMIAAGPISYSCISWKPIHWNEAQLANLVSAQFVKEIIC